MTRLSVNINKIATLRNARGGNVPNLLQVAKDCENYGAQGITVHPRPDERHIKYRDVYELKPIITTEFNIEGYPSQDWIELVKKVQPEQATLVPDRPDALTSDNGWDCEQQLSFLQDVVAELKEAGCRVSLFLNANVQDVEAALQTGTDRIEFYTGPYANNYAQNKEQAVKPYINAAKKANEIGLGINAGHDLDLNNLGYFAEHIPGLQEVSIGHALISDALYLGLEEAIRRYLATLN